MPANHEFVEYLEHRLEQFKDAMEEALINSNVGLHMFYKGKKIVIEDVLDAYYKTHVTDNERSGAI